MGDSPAVWTDGFNGPPGEFPEWRRVLTAEIVPDPDAPFYPDIADFALTFDGYAAYGGVGPVGEVANRVASEWHRTGELPDDLVVLRSCLFFEQRRFRHYGYGPGEKDMPYIRALVEAIRGYTRVEDPGWDDRFAEMLAEWIEVSEEIDRRRQVETEKVASEWATAFDSMMGAYLDLIARGEWQRGPEDMFNVIGLGRNEVRHSAMIAWLFDPLARHGVGPGFLEAVLDEAFPDEAHEVRGLITVETEVARGDTRADIVVRGADFTLIVETKVDAGEGDRQCDRLFERFGAEPGALFLFLTPKGRPPRTATGDAAEAFRSLSFPALRALLADLIGEDTGIGGVGHSTVRNYHHTLEKEFA